MGKIVRRRSAPRWNGRPAHAVKTVAPGDEVALQFVAFAVLLKVNLRSGGIEVVDANRIGLEDDLATRSQPRIHQVPDNVTLRVDHDATAAGKVIEIDAVRAAAKTQLDSAVNEPLAMHPLANTHLCKQIHRPLLKYARAHPLLTVFSAAGFQHDGFNALQMKCDNTSPAGPAPTIPTCVRNLRSCGRGAARHHLSDIFVLAPALPSRRASCPEAPAGRLTHPPHLREAKNVMDTSVCDIFAEQRR